jgi:methyl-accepting chemotaxis protein
VADEERALADRTAQAPQEIGQMITAIQQETRTAVAVMEKGVAEVEFGTTEAARSGEALHVIRDEIRTVNQQVQQIAIAAEEQTATTHEISANIQRITDVVQGTADGAHQTLTAAETLSALSNDFKGIVGRFRVGNRLDSIKDQAAALSIRCTETLERAVNDGRISMNELFSTDYKAVPHTNPQKYTTTFDRLFDDSIFPLQEEIVTRDGTISYAICVDRSGYCPSHNKRFTRPLTGNELQDRDGNRTKRIFNDQTGLRAATNTEPFLLQSYLRDTGEVMSDLSTPLMIGGKQWGAVRIGFLCDES